MAHCVVLKAQIIRAAVARPLICYNHQLLLHARLDEIFERCSRAVGQLEEEGCSGLPVIALLEEAVQCLQELIVNGALVSF